jgi:hypothetical protein
MFRKLHDPNSNITIEIDGVPTSAEPGDTVAAAPPGRKLVAAHAGERDQAGAILHDGCLLRMPRRSRWCQLGPDMPQGSATA